MANAITALPSRAGIFLSEGVAGSQIPSLAVYQRTYVLGTATLTTETEPGEFVTIPNSLDDFINLFGSSAALTLNNITAYLSNTRRGLYYARLVPSAIATIDLVGAAAAGAYTLTIEGVPVTYVQPASPAPTLQSVIVGLVTAINNNTNVNLQVEAEYNLDNNGAPDYAVARFRLRSADSTPFTVTATTANLTASAVTTPTTPQYWDWLAAIKQIEAKYADEPLGFLCCPEAFYGLANQFERTQVANQMEASCRALGWFALLDPGFPTIIDHPRKSKTDSANYNAVRGHSAYYYPYLVDSDADDVSPSIMVAAFALQRYEQEGIHQPPAGSKYPFAGISGVRYTLSNGEKDDLAQARVNIMVFKRGIGTIPFDTLTRSLDPNFKMISARIILSCIERSLQDTIDRSALLFEAVDGANLFYSRLKLLATGVLDNFYRAKALYGNTPGEAYAVRCDSTTQVAADLEAGIINFEGYVVPSPTARQIEGRLFRVQVGKVAEALALAAL